MPRPVRELPSPSIMVPALLRYAAARGHDVAPIVERFGWPADAPGRDELAVVPSAIDDLLTVASELLGEPFLALRLPRELPLRRYDVVEVALTSSATLRDGLLTTARHAAVIHPEIELHLDESGDEAIWRQRTPRHPRGIGRHAQELGLASVIVHARAGLAAALPATRVWFAHARPRWPLDPLRRMFGTDALAFGAPDSGFEFARSLLDAPLTGDRRLLATVEALGATRPPILPSTALAPRVSAHLRQRLADSAAAVAAALHMSARTLQRRLHAEGTSFSGIVDDTREALSRELLVDLSLPLAEIAYRVGFADLATFSRAFKRWTGKPPGLFRRL